MRVVGGGGRRCGGREGGHGGGLRVAGWDGVVFDEHEQEREPGRGAATVQGGKRQQNKQEQHTQGGCSHGGMPG
ncbi:MAG: hypothetical protein ABSH19_06135 [Opitutales bacterium]